MTGENNTTTQTEVSKEKSQITGELLETPKEPKKGLFKKGHDPRRNLLGNYNGTMHFMTSFEKALKGQTVKYTEKDKEGRVINEVEEEITTDLLVKTYIRKALKNDKLLKDVIDRIFGSPTTSHVIKSDNIITEITPEQRKEIMDLIRL